MSDRAWVQMLILASSSLDLNAWPADSTRGACVQCRDVLAGPPAYQLTDLDGLNNLDEWVYPSTWIPGTSSPTPRLAIAVASHFGKRPGMSGRLGARIYYAQLDGDWMNSAQAVTDGVALAANVEGDFWGLPEVVVLLREENEAITNFINQALPNVPVCYVPIVSPELIVLAVQYGLQNKLN